MGMEDDSRELLLLIVNTIALVLLWMMLGVLFGIYYEYAFFETAPGWKNITFYIVYATSLVFLLRYLWRKWKL